MRRFILSIPSKFKGTIEALYDRNGKLCKIEFSKDDLAPEVIKWFKAAIPVMVENIYTQFQPHGVTVSEAEFQVTFDDFTREYPYARNTHLAREHWPKMITGEQFTAVMEALEYRKYCERNKAWYKPMIAGKMAQTKGVFKQLVNIITMTQGTVTLMHNDEAVETRNYISPSSYNNIISRWKRTYGKAFYNARVVCIPRLEPEKPVVVCEPSVTPQKSKYKKGNLPVKYKVKSATKLSHTDYHN